MAAVTLDDSGSDGGERGAPKHATNNARACKTQNKQSLVLLLQSRNPSHLSPAAADETYGNREQPLSGPALKHSCTI